MSKNANGIPLARARELAESLRADLGKACARIEIAGSIRRRKPVVGDIELVAIPLVQGDLLGDPQSILDPHLRDLEERGLLRRRKWGPKYKQFEVTHAHCLLDLFLVSAETWGGQFLMRTGPESFNKRLVLPKSKGGLLPAHLQFKDGFRLWHSGRGYLDTREEAAVFAELGIKWLEPWERT